MKISSNTSNSLPLDSKKVNLFAAVKERVTARQAAELYGCKVNHAGFCLCVFHNDRHPSMKVDERYHCFSCGADGDVIDLTARLFALTPMGALRRLDADFNLGLPVDGRPLTAAERSAVAQQRAKAAERARFRQWVSDTANRLCGAWRVSHELFEADPATLTPQQLEAARWFPTIKAFMEILEDDEDEAAQLALFHDQEGIIRALGVVGAVTAHE